MIKARQKEGLPCEIPRQVGIIWLKLEKMLLIWFGFSQAEKNYINVGMESDYYTQVTGAGIKEGMLVIVQSTEEADNPFEMMMGL